MQTSITRLRQRNKRTDKKNLRDIVLQAQFSLDMNPESCLALITQQQLNQQRKSQQRKNQRKLNHKLLLYQQR